MHLLFLLARVWMWMCKCLLTRNMYVLVVLPQYLPIYRLHHIKKPCGAISDDRQFHFEKKQWFVILGYINKTLTFNITSMSGWSQAKLETKVVFWQTATSKLLFYFISALQVFISSDLLGFMSGKMENMFSEQTCCIIFYGLCYTGGPADALCLPSLSSTMFSKRAQKSGDSVSIAISDQKPWE